MGAFVKHHTMAKAVSEAFKEFYKNQFKKAPRIRQNARMMPVPSPDIDDKCYSRRSQSKAQENRSSQNAGDLNISREEPESFSPLPLKRKGSDLFLSSPQAKRSRSERYRKKRK